MRVLTRVLIVSAAMSGLTGCSLFGGVPGSPGSPGGGGKTNGGGTGAADSWRTTEQKSAIRKYAMWIPAGSTTPQYAVGDRNARGGQKTLLQRGSNKTGEIDAEYQTLPNKNGPLEGGDPMQGGLNLKVKNVSARSDGANVTDYVNDGSAYAAGQSDVLSVVELAYAQSTVSQFVDAKTGETYFMTSYSGRDDSIKPTTPTASATYKGQAGAQVITNASVYATQGDLTMNANVSGGGATVDGSITNIQVTDQKGNTSAANYQLALKQTAITDGEYSGTVEMQDLSSKATGDFSTAINADVDARADYHGAFYGPNGEETAGILDMTGTADTGSGNSRFDLVGGFIAKKQ